MGTMGGASAMVCCVLIVLSGRGRVRFSSDYNVYKMVTFLLNRLKKMTSFRKNAIFLKKNIIFKAFDHL